MLAMMISITLLLQSTSVAEHTPWTTSRVKGSPEPPPPFKVVRAFPNIKLNQPLLLVRGPEQNRMFVGEQSGVLYSFKDDDPAAKVELFCDLRKEIETLAQTANAKAFDTVYGLAFHPQFKTNRQCFVCYTLRGPGGRFPDGSRVSRFTVTKDDPPRIDPASEEVVLAFPAGGHNGGDLHFGNDGLLYISTGDAADPNPPDPLATGQDLSDLLASILRIDVDRQDEGKKYAIPKDNPFITFAGARPEVYAYGFRNPWRMSVDRQTGELFVGDVGWELWEMIHRVEKGGNYGWSAMEGPQPIKPERAGPTPIQPALIELPHTIACSITGGLVYRGEKFPELRGAYVFGDWETRRLWAARFEKDRVKEMPEIARPAVRVGSFGEDHAGEIYLLDQEAGTLHKLERNTGDTQNADFPTTLSRTGLFASVKEHKPAEGVTPFAINSRQWQDGATAEHLLALPGDAPVTLYNNARPVPGLVNWHNFRMHFPKDAVLARTLSLGGKRLETQLLHYDGLEWRAYTYAWRDDQQDADLVPADGDEKEIRVGDQTRLWQFHSRSQCLSCHNNQSQYALAFSPEQLNRNIETRSVSEDRSELRNQLIALTESGYIRRADNDKTLPPFDMKSLARERKLADPHDDKESLEARARSYLHANCGHCHSDHGGGAVPLRLQFPLEVASMKAVDAPPTRGDFGLAEARIIAPGDPHTSTLYFRMAKFGRDRMPHIGSELPDEAGLELIAKWITSLKGQGRGSDVDLARVDLPAADAQTLMIVARKLGRDEIAPAQRAALLASAAKLPGGPLRDLFEGYLPANGERKLGSSPRPKAILALHGDAARGEKLFWSEAINCGKCHRVGERGTPVGPDLSKIGAQRSVSDLLDSLLAPSRRIEPKFATYVAQTTDGRVIAGVLVQRDETAVILREVQGREIKLAAGDIEQLRPSPISLMPDGQLSGFTAQQAADLLEYLRARKD